MELLPGDRENLAIQTRGGPEKHEVTGWVLVSTLCVHRAAQTAQMQVANSPRTENSTEVTWQHAGHLKEDNLCLTHCSFPPPSHTAEACIL